LIDDEYFTVILVNGEKVRIKESTDFNTRIDSGAVLYEFSIPIDMDLGKITDISVTFFDVGYYISFAPVPEQQYSRVFEQSVSRQPVETLGWGEVDVPSLMWRKR
jgi:ABC-type uncharacterized transport system substrate-binding protein